MPFKFCFPKNDKWFLKKFLKLRRKLIRRIKIFVKTEEAFSKEYVCRVRIKLTEVARSIRGPHRPILIVGLYILWRQEIRE